jgi:hypothetical protein
VKLEASDVDELRPVIQATVCAILEEIKPLDALEKLADLLADRVIERINSEQQRVLVSREELAKLTGLGVRTIDRMAAGGSREKDASGREIWRESLIKLEPIRNGRKVMFDKTAALAAIKAGNGCR